MKAYRLTGLTALVAVLASGCTTADDDPPAPDPAACSAEVRRDVLPEWARAGFTDPAPSGVPFVAGAGGSILGVIFGDPLTSPPPGAGPANKILWVARQPVDAPDDLMIEARPEGSAEVVRREVPGGPGPSVVDLPRPGCWHLTLTWSHHTDTLDLRYAAGS